MRPTHLVFHKWKLNGPLSFLFRKTRSTWSCSKWECRTFDVTTKPVSSYLTISPLLSFPNTRNGKPYIFCCLAFPSPRTSRYKAFRPTEFGLSSPTILMENQFKLDEAIAWSTLDQRSYLAQKPLIFSAWFANRSASLVSDLKT